MKLVTVFALPLSVGDSPHEACRAGKETEHTFLALAIRSPFLCAHAGKANPITEIATTWNPSTGDCFEKIKAKCLP
jgi:hypothetical protein